MLAEGDDERENVVDLDPVVARRPHALLDFAERPRFARRRVDDDVVDALQLGCPIG